MDLKGLKRGCLCLRENCVDRKNGSRVFEVPGGFRAVFSYILHTRGRSPRDRKYFKGFPRPWAYFQFLGRRRTQKKKKNPTRGRPGPVSVPDIDTFPERLARVSEIPPLAVCLYQYLHGPQETSYWGSCPHTKPPTRHRGDVHRKHFYIEGSYRLTEDG